MSQATGAVLLRSIASKDPRYGKKLFLGEVAPYLSSGGEVQRCGNPEKKEDNDKFGPFGFCLYNEDGAYQTQHDDIYFQKKGIGYTSSLPLKKCMAP